MVCPADRLADIYSTLISEKHCNIVHYIRIEV